LIQNVIALSETGLRRRLNQDSVLALHTEFTGLFAIADGMGGHYRGEMASQMAVDFLSIWWEKMHDCITTMSFMDIVADLEKNIRKLNKELFQTYKEMGQSGGTTLCLLLIHHNVYAVLNVGDSRLYRCQRLSCVCITTDDVWENQMCIRAAVARGTMEKENVRNNPQYGRLFQALGAQENLTLPVYTGLVKRKTSFFLCSDGVYKYCKEAFLFWQIRKYAWKKNASVAARQIKNSVYKNGAKDNLSIIFVQAKNKCV